MFNAMNHSISIILHRPGYTNLVKRAEVRGLDEARAIAEDWSWARASEGVLIIQDAEGYERDRKEEGVWRFADID